ncbi:MAG: high-potential iron-sulfur protein [Gammaproteobacteria bacterium]|nr:high-potential iron-sulfur protein [Gammaproteobacteria bacterium]
MDANEELVMSDQPIAHGRRRAIKLALGGVVAIPLANVLLRTPAGAAKTISPSNPIAKQLKYVEKSTTKGELCSNCKYYGGGGKAGSCQLMQGQMVLAAGWCSAWASA